MTLTTGDRGKKNDSLTCDRGSRLSRRLTARTSGELAALTADLPEAGGIAARAKDVVRLDYEGGNATRRGRWIVPQRMQIRAVGGTVKLDFTNAVITSPTLHIQAEVRGGRLVLVTRPGIEVDADDVAHRTFWQWVLRRPGPYLGSARD